jgi:hypothetical protein
MNRFKLDKTLKQNPRVLWSIYEKEERFYAYYQVLLLDFNHLYN